MSSALSSPPSHLIESEPIGHSYLPLWDGSANGKFILVEGRRGTGKSRDILSVLVSRLLQVPGSRALLARSTRSRLSATILFTLEEQVFPRFGIRKPPGGREHRSIYQLPGGSELIPMGLDDTGRTQSGEFSWIYVAEAVEIPREDDVTALAGSLRLPMAANLPRGIPRHQCIVDVNPGPPGHWANVKAEPVSNELRRVRTPQDYRRLVRHNWAPPPEGKWKRIVTSFADNPYYWDATAWDWTTPGREYYTETLEHLSGHLRRRWLDGEWCAAEGVVYREFTESQHVITPFRVPDHWPIFLGMDPGYDHPCAIVWIAIGENGTLYVVDELYRSGLGVADHADGIKSRPWFVSKYYADPQHAVSRTAQSPRTIQEQLGDCGLKFGVWPRTHGHEDEMVEAVRNLLKLGKFKVFSTCTNTISEFQTWSYKRTASGELPPGEDKYEDRNNHCLDCVKGLVALNPTFAQPKARVE